MVAGRVHRVVGSMNARTSKPLRIATWIVSLLLAAMFLMSGITKVLGAGTTRADFERWGYPDWFRPVVGSGEILAALLLVLPMYRVFGAPLRFWGAAGLVGLMTGALFTHARIGEYQMMPVPLALLALAAFVAWTMRPAYLRTGRATPARTLPP